MFSLKTESWFLVIALALVAILLSLLGFLVHGRHVRQKREDRLRKLLADLDGNSGALLLGKNIDHRIFTIGRVGQVYRVSDGTGIVSADLEDVLHRLRWATDLTVRKGSSPDQNRQEDLP